MTDPQASLGRAGLWGLVTALTPGAEIGSSRETESSRDKKNLHLPWKDKYEKVQEGCGGGAVLKRWARAWPWRCRQAVFSVCPVVCLQRALPRVTVARGPGLYLSEPGQCCALIVMRVNSGPAVFSRLLCPLSLTVLHSLSLLFFSPSLSISTGQVSPDPLSILMSSWRLPCARR